MMNARAALNARKFTIFATAMVIACIVLCLALSGCSILTSEADETNSQFETEEQEERALANLEDESSDIFYELDVGEGADFGEYTITVYSAETDEDYLVVNYAMKVLEEFTYNFDALWPYINDTNGQRYDATGYLFEYEDGVKTSDFPTVLEPGTEVTILAFFDKCDLESVSWEDSLTSSTWSFSDSD
ncbi:MAG: hypothetical protein LUB61_01870 [Eggerthellaceae bacterium]|nr:hypothetical protein [Eggerthellaceae bacterium]